MSTQKSVYSKAGAKKKQISLVTYFGARKQYSKNRRHFRRNVSEQEGPRYPNLGNFSNRITIVMDYN